jgi:hypothetical protein
MHCILVVEQKAGATLSGVSSWCTEYLIIIEYPLSLSLSSCIKQTLLYWATLYLLLNLTF